MPKKKYIVELTQQERSFLENFISSGKASARSLTRARILLKADSGPKGPAWIDEKICEALEVSMPTVNRTRQRFVEEDLQASLSDRKRRGHRPKKLDGRAEAKLIALACSQAPEGCGRWTLRLLAEKFVELEHTENISHETVRQVLKKANLNLG